MFLHTFTPSPILFSLGPISIYWYGLLVVLGIVAGLFTATRLGRRYGVSRDTIFDLSFYLIIAALIGARLYDVLLELPYYLDYPLDTLKVWQGGLAIHGAILAGAATLYWFVRKHKLDFVQLMSILVPGLAIGQAVGRWGNYFNQELFGQPTDLPWGILIETAKRPAGYLESAYFHPTFLYESLGCLALAIVLIALHYRLKTAYKHLAIVSAYLIGYSLLRFGLEFIRIDYAPVALGLRWPQIISLLIIIATLVVDYYYFVLQPKRKNIN